MDVLTKGGGNHQSHCFEKNTFVLFFYDFLEPDFCSLFMSETSKKINKSTFQGRQTFSVERNFFYTNKIKQKVYFYFVQ